MATFSDVDYHGHLKIAYNIARQFAEDKRHKSTFLRPVPEENNRVSYIAHKFVFQRCHEDLQDLSILHGRKSDQLLKSPIKLQRILNLLL